MYTWAQAGKEKPFEKRFKNVGNFTLFEGWFGIFAGLRVPHRREDARRSPRPDDMRGRRGGSVSSCDAAGALDLHVGRYGGRWVVVSWPQPLLTRWT